VFPAGAARPRNGPGRNGAAAGQRARLLGLTRRRRTPCLRAPFLCIIVCAWMGGLPAPGMANSFLAWCALEVLVLDSRAERTAHGR
jgi:hypothetical protein